MQIYRKIAKIGGEERDKEKEKERGKLALGECHPRSSSYRPENTFQTKCTGMMRDRGKVDFKDV